MQSTLLLTALLIVGAQLSLARNVPCESKSFVYKQDYENSHGHHCEFAPAKWALINPRCKDTPDNRPSPINIELSVCKARTPALTQLQFGPGWLEQAKFVVKNNGHSIQADAENSDALTVTGGHLTGKYNCVQFHFHWGSAENMEKGIGSEHRLFDATGKLLPTPMEVHIVCKRLEMTFEQAANTPDAIAVLGVFIQPQRTNEPETRTSRLIAQLLSDMSNLYAPVSHDDSGDHSETAQNVDVELKLNDLLPGSPDRFVNYDGALTTPGCNPVVQWHVFTEPARIHRELMTKFTKVFFDKDKTRPMEDNFRPVMGRHGREIRCSFSNDEASSPPAA